MRFFFFIYSATMEDLKSLFLNLKRFDEEEDGGERKVNGEKEQVERKVIGEERIK